MGSRIGRFYNLIVRSCSSIALIEGPRILSQITGSLKGLPQGTPNPKFARDESFGAVI